MNTKKFYYYIICLVTFFVLMWGVVDVISATLSLTIFKTDAVAMEAPAGSAVAPSERTSNAEPSIEDYYQKRMIYDRMGDSIARILIAGLIFAYARYKAWELEK